MRKIVEARSSADTPSPARTSAKMPRKRSIGPLGSRDASAARARPAAAVEVIRFLPVSFDRAKGAWCCESAPLAGRRGLLGRRLGLGRRRLRENALAGGGRVGRAASLGDRLVLALV